jgi:pyruvate dehydrogenase E1 component alpha subunit
MRNLSIGLFELYSEMLKIRMIEQRISLEYLNNEIRCPTHLSIGQELMPAMIKFVAHSSDYAVSTHRGHAHYISKGGDIRAFIAELYGKSTGCSGGIGGSMHLFDLDVNFMGSTAIVANTIPIGLGLAQAAKINGRNQVSFIFLGEGATEEGVFYESINYAAVSKIPAIFICENNDFSVYADLSCRQPIGRKLTEMVQGIGVASFKLEPSDPLESFKVLERIIGEVRLTNEPAFIEIDTFRFLEHCGPNNDDNLGYRNSVYISDSLKNDPLSVIENELMTKIPDFIILRNNIASEVDHMLNDAFDFAKNSAYPDYDAMGDLLYSKVQI